MIYLDSAATTRMRPEVRAAMEPFLGAEFGNASSPHAAGRRARRALEDARETTASCLEVDPKEIVFTSGATESNALALRGVAEALRGRGNHLITSAIEHPSVLESLARLEKEGWRVTRIPVDGAGRLDPARVAEAVTGDTVLVSIMSVNNETGTVQPIAAIREAAPRPVLHTDAAQAVGKIPFRARDADLVTLSAHKIHGPKGVGALVVRKGIPLAAQLVGGGQEFERRGGTENVAGAVGLAVALKLACEELPVAAPRMEALRERLRRGLEALGGIQINGSPDSRAPHILNVSVDGTETEPLVLSLDAEGVCISSGSACASLSLEPSPVLRAMGVSEDRVRRSVRFSLSSQTQEADVDGALAAVANVLGRLRKVSPVAR